MTDQLDISVSPKITAAHVVKVSCPFSPTGVHYIKMMLSEKTNVKLVMPNKAVLVTQPHLKYINCECQETVPKDVLEGMSFMRDEDDVSNNSTCFETMNKALKLILECRNESTFIRRDTYKKKISSFPMSLRPVVEYLVTHIESRHPVFSDTKSVTGKRRAIALFTEIFNREIFGFVPNDGFRCGYNKYGIFISDMKTPALPLAQRYRGKWYVVDTALNWEKVYWASNLTTFGSHCYTCEKDTNTGSSGRNHSPYSDIHAKNAVRKLKMGLIATCDFPKLKNLENELSITQNGKLRLPNKIDKYKNIVILSEEMFHNMFSVNDDMKEAA